MSNAADRLWVDGCAMDADWDTIREATIERGDKSLCQRRKGLSAIVVRFRKTFSIECGIRSYTIFEVRIPTKEDKANNSNTRTKT